MRLDVLGALTYCSVWLGIGYAFSGFLREIAAWMGRATHAALFLLLLLGFGICAGVARLHDAGEEVQGD